jgi:hypothetical protein
MEREEKIGWRGREGWKERESQVGEKCMVLSLKNKRRRPPWQAHQDVFYNHNYTFALLIAIDHRTWKTGLPVRSAVLKPCAGRLVVGWVTTSEYLLLIVFEPGVFWPQTRPLSLSTDVLHPLFVWNFLLFTEPQATSRNHSPLTHVH